MLRRDLTPVLQERISQFPAVALLGPRQCGKSTLAQEIIAARDGVLLDLERPSDLARLRDPEAFFAEHPSTLVCLDEIQRAPEIFPVLRGVLDRGKRNGQVLLLGSASPALLRQSSESLAGRLVYLELTPLTLREVTAKASAKNLAATQQRHLVRGGFPRSFLAESDEASFTWRESFLATFVERDLAQLAPRIDPQLMRRFVQMVAHFHGDLWNGAKIAGALGISNPTVRSYLDLLAGAFLLRVVPPFEANTKKRLVKSPKVYIRDTGLLNTVLALETWDDLLGHPVYGNLWESHVIEQVAPLMPRWNLTFYRTSAGAECDIVLSRGTKRLCIECKASTAPQVTKGFWSALEDLKPTRTWIAAPVKEPYSFGQGVTVTPVRALVEELAKLG